MVTANVGIALSPPFSARSHNREERSLPSSCPFGWASVNFDTENL